MTQPVGDEQEPDVYRDVNGTGVLNMQSPYLPFSVQEKTNLENSVMICGQVPTTDATIHNINSEHATRDDSTDFTSRSNGDKLFGNGNIGRNKQYETDIAKEEYRTENSTALSEASVSCYTTNGCSE